MDAEIQAMDGNQSVAQVLDPGKLPSLIFPSVDTRASVVSHSLPSLDAGFRHPGRNDDPPTLVYNVEYVGRATAPSLPDKRLNVERNEKHASDLRYSIVAR